VSTVKIRVWGTEEDCDATVDGLKLLPGMVVLSVSGWAKDQPRQRRGGSPTSRPSESILGRVYVEADIPSDSVELDLRRRRGGSDA
jgi:hypothetical protein